MEENTVKKGLFYYYTKVIDAISSFFAAGSSAMLIACAIIVIYGIVVRGIGKPSLWAEDVVVYLLVMLIFLCLADGLRTKSHISADLLLSKMNNHMKELMSCISSFIAMVCSGVFAYYFVRYAMDSYSKQERSYGYTRLLLWPCKFVVTVGLIVLALVALRNFVIDIQKFAKNNTGEKFGAKLNNPALVIGCFVVLLAISIFLLTKFPIAGILVLLLTFLMAGIPIGFSIMATAMLAFLIVFDGGKSLATMPAIGYAHANRYSILALPMFMFAGNVMAKGGLGDAIFDFCKVWVGHIRGGLGIAVVIACTIFGALSGSASACAFTIGSIAFPVLLEAGYGAGTIAGLVAVSGGIGILIPPSNAFTVYGLVSETSIGRLFIAGIAPGLLMAIALIVALLVTARKQNLVKMPKADMKTRITTTGRSFWALLMPVIVLGGIYTGIFTISEAASIAALYAVIYSLCAKSLNLKQLWQIMIDSVHTVSFTQLILIASAALQKNITLLRLPQLLVEYMANVPGWVFILIVMVFCLFLGMFLEGAAITTLTVPVLMPLLSSYGFDLYWYAAILVVNETLGSVTPPVGINLFIMQKIGKIDAGTVFKGAIPFVAAVLILLIVLCLFPQITLWLPSHMMG